ncbi:adenosylcobinamide-GDP ribazoletransferase [Clostridium cellulovorans]|uniref:Adenosylcobinamide-GDP ribazoletransferase n=1 Tax=Clostridium cellulovorans (strain ATCC 35296 / DSM 3052 / OCM 3 / 743B) TaxID=573061 RepID=D9SNY7_CLOC7|nr:adenosylcobinamide-GDP ribazoletransferase [Clostridium cellulovorans]ADL51952.1 cobalamin 5'-phosphate synthase [Clostridium cellulovorans 743B]
MIKSLILTIQFLTRIPININIDIKENDISKGIIYFPIVGVILGAFDLIVYNLAGYVVPGYFQIVCAVLAYLCLTGAFHIDGLADTADAIYSSRKKEVMLEIMKDSRVGTNGVIAIIFDLILKILLISVSRNIPIAIFLSPVVGKLVQPILMYKANYPRENGLGNIYIGKVTLLNSAICCILGTLITTIGVKVIGIIATLGCLFFIFLFRKYIEKKIGGITGDILGAGSELAEVLFLLILAI